MARRALGRHVADPSPQRVGAVRPAVRRRFGVVWAALAALGLLLAVGGTVAAQR